MTVHQWRDAFIRYMKSGAATEREWSMVAQLCDPICAEYTLPDAISMLTKIERLAEDGESRVP
jgi:hypothetical protein